MPQAIPIVVSLLAKEAGWTAIQSMIAVTIASAAAGAIASEQAKRGMNSSLAIEAKSRQQIIRSASSPRRVIYGEVVTSGTLVYAESTGSDDQYLHLVITVAGHEVEEIGEIYLNDEVLDANNSRYSYVDVYKHLGSTTQAADSNLIAASSQWTSAHRLQGIAYIYLRLNYPKGTEGADLWPTGIPQIKVKVKGKKVYDPRSSSTSYSPNWALCVRDYLVSSYGLNCASDEINEASFIAAANISDEVTDTGDVRYTCNGTIDLDKNPSTVMDSLISAGVGSLCYTQGAYTLYAGAYTSPVGSLDETHLRGGIKLRPRPSKQDLVNSVQGTFVSPDQSWQLTDFPPMSNDYYISQDGGDEIWLDLELPFTTSSLMAQRIAKIHLERGRQGAVVDFPATFYGMQFAPGDTVSLTIDQLGYNAKEFRVLKWSLSPESGGVDLTLQEEASGVYDWANGDQTTYDLAADTTLPNPFFCSAPTGISIESGDSQLFLAKDGTILTRMAISWFAPSSGFVVGYEVDWKPHAETVYQRFSTTTEGCFLGPFQDGSTYDVRVRAINSLGVRSVWASYVNYVVLGKSAKPPTPASFFIDRQADGTREFTASYTAKPLDFAGYRIYYKLGSGQVIDSMTLMNTEGLITTFPYESNQLAAGTYSFALTAVDTTGNESDPLYSEATLGDPRLGSVAYSEYPASLGWPGTKTDCYVTHEGSLEANSSGTWDDETSWDTFVTWMSGAASPIVYEHTEIDLGFELTFTPLISMLGAGVPVFEVNYSLNGIDYSGWEAPSLVTARYLKVRATLTGTACFMKQMAILLSAATITEEINDLDSSGLSATYRPAAGDFRLPITKSFSHISQVQIALQSVGPGWSWELIDKDISVGPRIKIYNSAGTLADANIDAFIRGA